MSLTKEYKEMFARHTKEEDDLAHKYAKHKIGSFVKIKGKKWIVSSVFPEEQNDGSVEVMYVLHRYGEKDLWIVEEEIK